MRASGTFRSILPSLFAVMFRLMAGPREAGAQAAAAPPQAVTALTQAADRLQLALSSSEYPVTPADVYRLVFHQSQTELVAQDIQVGSDLSIDLGIFGKIDAKGLAFVKLKKKAEQQVAATYSRSYPNLSIVSVGIFRVAVHSSYSGLIYASAWGLSRVSDVIAGGPVPGNSVRNVVLDRSDASPIACDIFMAIHSPRLEDQDPLVRPGDSLRLSPSGPVVHLVGEVRRPGDYELAPGEGLRELIEFFGGGLTMMADSAGIRVDRVTAGGIEASFISLPGGFETAGDLGGCISVTVASRADIHPVIWFEGPGIAGSSTSTPAVPGIGKRSTAAQAQGRIGSPIVNGQKLSDAVRNIKDQLSPLADLAGASLIRAGSPARPIDLESLLSNPQSFADLAVQGGDRIIVPATSAIVSVAGAVNSPGSFPFEPGMGAQYYIGLAGGADSLRNTNGEFSVMSGKGVRRETIEELRPGDSILLPDDIAVVTVSGAVNSPGAIAFHPRKAAAYYINKAGGIDPDRNPRGSYWVTDPQGKRIDPESPLESGYRIYVPSNGFGYNFIRLVPVLTTLCYVALSAASFVMPYLLK